MWKVKSSKIGIGAAGLGAVALIAALILFQPDLWLLRWSVQGLNWLGQLFWAGWVLVLPGWALLSGLWRGWRELDWVEKLGFAGGVSLAGIPVLLLWLNLAGLHAASAGAWGFGLLGASFLVWKNRNSIAALPRALVSATPRRPDSAAVALFVVVACIVGIRIWAVRGIEYPMWGDSLQHAVITQRILEENGLFQSWQPYAPYATLTVQYGFPAAAAFYAWVSGANSSQAVVWIGQILNGLAVLSLYPLAMRFSKRRRWAGIAALVVGGLLVPMPMMYVNWGRYAQLAGQAVLPAAICFCGELVSAPRFDLKKAAITALTLTGMLLAYYRMFFYIATFLIAWLAAWGLFERHFSWKNWKTLLASAGGALILAALLVSPWLLNVKGSSLAGGLEAGVSASTPLQAIQADYRAWTLVSDYVPNFILAFCGLALLWSLFKRAWSIAGIALWVVLLGLFKAGQLIHLPGANMMQSFAVLIFLYAPASLLCGWLFAEFASLLQNRSYQWAGWVLAVLVMGASAWGAYQNKNIAQPGLYGYVTGADIQAARWIRQNTPGQAVFLVEGFSIYTGTSAVGSDAGWWLPLTAGRQNTMPPQYALLNEKPETPDYSLQVVNLIKTLEANSPASPAGLRAICQMHVTHAYIGQRQGMVGFDSRQLFSRESLVNTTVFKEIYNQDQVSVFALNPQACQSTAYVEAH